MSKVDDLIAAARGELGSPYVYGDEGPDTFDCSGLIQFVLAQVGIQAPRTAAEQQRWATPVTTARPGDLVFWGRPATHVGLYIGDGRMIAAPHPGARVQIQDVYGTPAGYGRVPGLGAAIAPVLGLAEDAFHGVAGFTPVSWGSDTLATVKRTALQITIGGLGLVLIGFGVWRATGATRARMTRELL